MRPGIVSIAISGGLDSLYSLVRLRQEGYNVVALHGKFHGGAEADAKAEAVAEICRRLDVSFAVADLRRKFERLIISPFRRDYLRGLTPNPCSRCNGLIKFGLLKDAAVPLNADYFATGHYARLVPSPYAEGASRLLAPPADSTKDQTYFLALVPGERFENVLFPLSGKMKREIRTQLAALGLATAEERESRDICFIPRGEKKRFFAAFSESGKGGPILLRDQVSGAERQIGRHDGLENFTPGQRRGLGIAWREPLYVLELRRETNALLVAERKFSVSMQLEVEPLNFFVPFALWPARIQIRSRYRGKLAEGRVEWVNGGFRCFFTAPQTPAAPGQIAVFYDGAGLVLGAGAIK